MLETVIQNAEKMVGGAGEGNKFWTKKKWWTNEEDEKLKALVD